MTLKLSTIVLDVADMKRALTFWTAALDYEATHVSETWTLLEHPERQSLALGLQPNPDPKGDVNRAHLDLCADDVPGEVARLEALGARRIPWEYTPGATHVVLQDTEGNEFCVVPA